MEDWSGVFKKYTGMVQKHTEMQRDIMTHTRGVTETTRACRGIQIYTGIIQGLVVAYKEVYREERPYRELGRQYRD